MIQDNRRAGFLAAQAFRRYNSPTRETQRELERSTEIETANHLQKGFTLQRITIPPAISEIMDVCKATSFLADTLTNLQKQLAKKQSFESAIISLTHIVSDQYATASQSDQKLIYTAVCRAATLLKTRYTAQGFWMAGLELFEATLNVVNDAAEKENMKSCIRRAGEIIGEAQESDNSTWLEGSRGPGFLFEGQLTVDPEPPRPAWMVAQNFVEILASEHMQSSMSSGETSHAEARLQMEQLLHDGLGELMQRMDGSNDFGTGLEEAIQATLQEMGSMPHGTPPASKEVVEKLPVVDVTEPLLKQIGEGVQCAVCREELVIGDKMQKMPCEHSFHSDCLKPWLDEHNSCPICRFELKTDDHDYESKKERDKEFEEERKGAENAVRGGEFMYV